MQVLFSSAEMFKRFNGFADSDRTRADDLSNQSLDLRPTFQNVEGKSDIDGRPARRRRQARPKASNKLVRGNSRFRVSGSKLPEAEDGALRIGENGEAAHRDCRRSFVDFRTELDRLCY